MSNFIHISGRLTDDVEISNEGKLLSFSIADNNVYYTKEGEKREEVEYHNCERWVGEKSNLADHLKKGKPVVVVGRLTTNKWEDDKGPRERKVVKVDGVELF